MSSCITEDYKSILTGLIEQETEKSVLLSIVGAIPLCQPAAPPSMREEKKRALPSLWGLEPVYVDAKGKKTTHSSPSALVKVLGLPMSGIQCDPAGKKCRALSAIDILRIQGYTVSGNGEPRKAAEGGKKLTVYHPDAVKEK